MARSYLMCMPSEVIEVIIKYAGGENVASFFMQLIILGN